MNTTIAKHKTHNFLLILLTLALLTPVKANAQYPEKDSLRRSPMHFAAMFNDVEEIEKLLDAGEKIDVRDKDKCTPLHLVAGLNKEAAMLLIERGADLDKKDKNGNTPMHLAAIYKDMEILVEMLDQGADPNIRNKYKNTVLHLVVEDEAPEIVKALVAKGGDVNMENREKLSPLEIAVDFLGLHSETVALLINEGADTDIELYEVSILNHMIEEEVPNDLIKMVINDGIEASMYDDDYETPLVNAILQSNGEIVDLLIKNGADVNALVGWDDWPLLSYCIQQEAEKDMILKILDAGADINATGGWDDYESSPLAQAEWYNRDLHHELLKRGVKLVEYDDYEMWDFADNYLSNAPNANMVTWVLRGKKNEYLNIKETPILYQAIKAEYVDDTIIELINKGCCIACGPKNWFSPLMAAIQTERPVVLKALLEAGAIMDKEYLIEGDLIRPIEFAVMYNQLEMVNTMLDHGAELDFTSFLGYDTFFEMVVYETYNEDLIIKLLDMGEVTHQKDVLNLDIGSELQEVIDQWFEDL